MNKLHENVESAVASLGGAYKVHDHSTLPSEIKNPNDFAAALGYPIQRITKTLFLRSHDGQSYAVAVCSMDRRLDFKSTARAVGVKRIETASAEDLRAKTDYPRNGVSPLGLPGDVQVIIDKGLLDYPTVLIGGGSTGIEVELAPADLVHLSKGTVESITV